MAALNDRAGDGRADSAVFGAGSTRGGDHITLLGRGFGGNLSAYSQAPGWPPSYTSLGYMSSVTVSPLSRCGRAGKD